MKKLSTLIFLAVLVLGVASCAKLEARDDLNKGVRAFGNQKYDDSIKYFKAAIELDPSLTNAELYLATAYAQMFIPNVTSEENMANAKNAIDTYESVLKRPGEANNVSAVAGLASMYQNTNDLPKARDYYQKESQLDPGNKAPWYAVGSVNWYIVYPEGKKEEILRNRPPEKNKKKDAKDAPPEPAPPMSHEEQEKLIDEGLASLDKALMIDPDYEDAMAYENLLLREKGRLAVAAMNEKKDKAGAAAEEKKYKELADAWYDKILVTRKKNQEKKKGPGGIVLDSPEQK